MTRTIVIPLSDPREDAVDVADRALTYARMLVHIDDAQLLLVSAIDTEATRSIRQEYLDSLATIIGPNVETLAALGNPVDVILDVAATVTNPVIVMASHGRRGVQLRLLGSVASSVARMATCPVLLFPAASTNRDTSDEPIKRVLLPMTDPSIADALVDAIITLLGTMLPTEIEFRLVEVAAPIPPHPVVVGGDPSRVAHELPAHFLRGVAKRIQGRGYRATWDLRIGDPSHELMRSAEEDGVNLIVMPSHGRKGFNSLVHEILAEQARLPQPVPVLLVPLEVAVA